MHITGESIVPPSRERFGEHGLHHKFEEAPRSGARIPVKTKVLDLGVRSVINLKDLINADKKFSPTAEIRALMNKRFEFYRVILVAGFLPKEHLKFSTGKIHVKMQSKIDILKANIHSISPSINEKKRVTKTFAIGADANVVDIANTKGSYTDERTYEEIHPIVVSTYAAKRDATWEFVTNAMVKQVRGAQVVEFVVKQQKNIVSEWSARPDGELNHEGSVIFRKFKSFFSGDSERLKSRAETFQIPMD